MFSRSYQVLFVPFLLGLPAPTHPDPHRANIICSHPLLPPSRYIDEFLQNLSKPLPPQIPSFLPASLPAPQGIGPLDGTVPGIPDRRIDAMHTLYRDAEVPDVRNRTGPVVPVGWPVAGWLGGRRSTGTALDVGLGWRVRSSSGQEEG